MKSKDLINAEMRQTFIDALHSDDENALSDAFVAMAGQIENDLKADAQAYRQTQDASILQSRGVHQLTSAEREYWNKFITAAKSNNPKAAVTDLNQALPTTILSDVISDIKAKFELLDAINFNFTGALSKYIIDASPVNKATWSAFGSTNSPAEISGQIKALDVHHNKLVAYIPVSEDFLQEGPEWVDTYVRALLVEAIGNGLEDGIVNGNGLTEPIGMTKDLSKAVDQSTGYADKTASAITDLGPATYADITSGLAKTPAGKARPIPEVLLVVNTPTYHKRILPATTVMKSDGTYALDTYPYPTKVVKSEAVADDKAVFGIANSYVACVGIGGNAGVITYSDEYKFGEDLRAYKIKLFANGQPKDNNCFCVKDVSKVEAYVPTIKTKAVTA